MTSHKLLQGFVGTQAYMAPEVFTRNMHEGHGRAADIWFVNPALILDLNISVLLISGWKNWVKKKKIGLIIIPKSPWFKNDIDTLIL